MDPEQLSFLPYQRARFATQLPVAYRYSLGHYWIARQDPQVWRVGLTKFGSRLIGEMVDYGFDATPGSLVTPGKVIGWIEGFKAIADLFCVGLGEFAGINPALDNDIVAVNRDPYGAGWLYAIKGEPDSTCMNVQAYAALLDRTIDKLRDKTP